MARLPDSLSPRERARVRAVSARLSLMAILLLALVGSLAAAAEGGNLALGRPYTMSPAPSYGLCSDAGDAVQLTDGKPAGEGCFWTQPAAVGWASVNPVEIEIDLGSVRAIDGVSLSTASRLNAGVGWPWAAVGVSDNGQKYRVVANLFAQPPAQQDPTQEYRQTLSADKLHARGRYVLFFVGPGESFVFLDELTVTAGAFDPGEVDMRQPEYTRASFRWFRDWQRQRQGMANRAVQLAGQIRSLLGEAGLDVDASDGLEQAILGLRALAKAPPVMGLEIGDTEDPTYKVARCASRANAVLHPGRTAFAWVPDAWEPLSPLTLVAKDAKAGVEVEAASNEYSSAAVNLTNVTMDPLHAKVALSDLVARGDRLPAGAVQLRQAIFVESAGGEVAADALPLLADSTLQVPAGETRQVWLTFPKRRLPAGDYRGALTITTAAETLAVPVRLRVHRVEVPAQAALQTYHWDYVNTFGLVKGLQREAVADLTGHYTNTYVFSGPDLPWPTFDAQGQGKIDFAAHDANLALHHGAREVSWFWGLGRESHFGNRLGAPLTSEEGRRRFAWWLRAWVAHLQELGYGYNRFFMYPYDETLCPEFRELAALIKQVDPRVRIFADPVADDTTDMIKAIAPYIDIWCPHLATYEKRPADIELMRAPGKKLWTYLCSGPAKLLPPLDYYRLMPWRAWRLGMTGCGFWAYADAGWTGDDAWDDFDGTHHDYAVIYAARNAPPGVPRTEAIIPSKRWEAWREGVEDYQLLIMTKERADKLGDTAQGKALRQAIDRAVTSVLKDRTTLSLQQARRELLAALAAPAPAIR